MSLDYKLVMYQAAQGPRAGLVLDGAVFDVATLTGNASYGTTLGILGDWDAAQPELELAARKTNGGLPLDKTKLLAAMLYPSAVYCAGANYADHLQEMARAQKIQVAADPRSEMQKPWHFLKAPRSVVGTQTAVALPAYAQRVDWEAELAAVIGRPAKNVTERKALKHVAGYTIGNDLSARDAMSRTTLPPTSPFRFDWLSQKSFDGACPLGPWLVPAKQVPNPQNLGIKLWVNDVLKQDSNTGKMIFSIAEQIAFLSTRITLHPGDVILTGTPAGVGMARGEYLKRGDLVRVWIEGIGTLVNTMA